MTFTVWLLAGLLVAAVIAALLWSASRRSEAQLSAIRQEMQNSIATQGQNMSAQMSLLVQTITQQLGQVRQEVQTGVASTGQLAAEAQRDVAARSNRPPKLRR